MPEPRLHYDVHGTGDRPLALLVHGFLSSRAQWAQNIDALCVVVRPVVVELYGHGRSPAPEDPAAYHPDAYVREFERIREELGEERWCVIGQSLGAALTLRYVLAHPGHVLAHVFTNSTSALADAAWAEGLRDVMERQSARLQDAGPDALAAHPLHPLRSTHLTAAQRAAFEADSALLNPRGIAMTGLHTIVASAVGARAAQNLVPTMLVAGEREERFAPHRRFAEGHMPLLEVVGLDGGHAVNIDAAAAFNAAVVAFLRLHLD